jgi:hypothetical protein
MRRLTTPLLVLLALAFLTWAYFAPQLTIHAMRTAAERGDAEALADHVDFPALRESMKRQFAEAVSDRIDGQQGLGAFRDLGVGLATAISGPAIDAMVSPQSLTLMFTGRSLARSGLAAATASGSSGEPIDGGIELPHWRATMGYEDFSTFTVRLQPDDDTAPPSKLIFKRHNLLWWKLSGIEVTPD